MTFCHLKNTLRFLVVGGADIRHLQIFDKVEFFDSSSKLYTQYQMIVKQVLVLSYNFRKH